MPKKIQIRINNPPNEAGIDHIEMWWKLGEGGTYAQLGSDIPFVSGSSDYLIEDLDVADGVTLYYQARSYNASGDVTAIANYIQVGGVIDLYEPHWIDQYDIPPQDANGWTILSIPVGAQVVYVSEAGDDALAATQGAYALGDFPDMFNPTGEQAYLTFAAAMDTLRSGEPDVVLFKKGDEFDVPVRRTVAGGATGSVQLIGSYGSAAARPVINSIGQDSAILSFHNRPGYAWIVGLEITSHERDYNHADYLGDGNVVTDPTGIEIASSTGISTDVLIEDCFIHNVNSGLTSFSTPDGSANIIVRRNVIADAYASVNGGHPQGAGFRHKILVEENIFVDCGWHKYNPVGAGAARIYSHSVYSTTMSETIFRKNISYDPSSIHFKFVSIFRDPLVPNTNSSYDISLYDNLTVGGEVATNIDGNMKSGDIYGFRYADVRVQGNVSVGINTHQNAGRTLAWGYRIQDLDSGIVSDNLMLHLDNPALTETFCATVVNYADSVTMTNNHSFNANSSTSGASGNGDPQTNMNVYGNPVDINASEYLDPTRDIESYMTSIGELATLEEFSRFLKLQSKDNWDVRFECDTVNNYIKAGYIPLVNSIIIINDITDGYYTQGASSYIAEVDPAASYEITYAWYVDGVIDNTNTSRVFVSTLPVGSFTLRCDVTANGVTLTGDIVNVTEEVPRQYLEFSKANASYASLPYYNIQGTDSVSVRFSYSDASQSTFTILGESFSNTKGVTIKDGSKIKFRNGSSSSEFNVPNVRDGLDHQMHFTRDAGGVATLTLDGVDYTLPVNTMILGFDTINRYSYYSPLVAKVWDLETVIGGVTTKYNIDSGSTTTEAASVGTGTMTFNNVVAGDWS